MADIGIIPVEYKVLIRPEEVVDRSEGGIFLPETSREREQLAIDRGELIAKSEAAFSDWKGRVPDVGDKVIFAKYAGTVIQFQHPGEGGLREKFRLCNDKDVCAIINE